MSPPRLRIDFAKRHRPLSLAGGLLLLLGVGAALATYVEYRALDSRLRGAELRLEAANHRSHPDSAQTLRTSALAEEAGRTAEELAAPWTALLAELEAASRDSSDQVSLLSVEPDHAKHRLRITGESRSLPLALAYVQRLQTSAVLRYPMLESHEVKTDDAQRPVRFAMTADWKEAP